jgi:hypothetical protein
VVRDRRETDRVARSQAMATYAIDQIDEARAELE